MDAIADALIRGVEQLLARVDGPLHFRLAIQPAVVIILAIRAGLRDARAGQAAFGWAVLTNPRARRGLLLSAVRDIGRVFIVALLMDTTYQLLVLRWLYPLQLLIVALACAIVPYVLLRGPTSRLVRLLYRHKVA